MKYLFAFLLAFSFLACATSRTDKFEERQGRYAQQADKYRGLYASCSGDDCDSLLWWAANSQFRSEDFLCSLAVNKDSANECRHIGSRLYFWELKRKYGESRYSAPTFIRLAYIEDLNGQSGIANEILLEFVKNWPNHEMTSYARRQIEIYKKRKPPGN